MNKDTLDCLWTAIYRAGQFCKNLLIAQHNEIYQENKEWWDTNIVFNMTQLHANLKETEATELDCNSRFYEPRKLWNMLSNLSGIKVIKTADGVGPSMDDPYWRVIK